MALPSLASIAELATWLNATIADGDARATLVLDAASGLVRSAAGQTWVDADNALLADRPADAKTYTLLAASRAWQNPTGAQRKDETTGPFATSLLWGDAGTYLTDEEREILERYSTSTTGGIGVLSTTRGHIETGGTVRDPFDMWNDWHNWA